MSPDRQQFIGLALASGIIGGFTLLHLYALFAFSGPAWLGGAIFLLLAWLSVGLFIVAHDAMHGSLAPRNRMLNDRIGSLCLLLYANFSYPRLHPQHHRHHAAPGSAEDPDFHPDRPRAFWAWFWRFFTTYFGWRELGLMTARVLLYLLLGASMGSILLFFAGPSLLAAFQLFFFGTWLPHRQGDEAFADGHNTRSNDYPPLLSLLTCFHFGYHHAHHLHPGQPWWRLPAFHRR